MENFLPECLIARHAILAGTQGNASITILMVPFLCNQEIVDTCIRLDTICLPSTKLNELGGRVFEFPANPIEGYIDGSIYLGGAHHPVDVTLLKFNKSRDGDLTLIVKGIYVFDFEGLGKLGNTPFKLDVSISACTI